MLGRRMVYGAALLAALLFQILYDGYLAQFFLVCVLALPLLSLLLSLRGVRGLELGLSPSAPRLRRGSQGAWQVTVSTASSLPVPQLTVSVSFQNTLTGQKTRQRIRLSGLGGGVTRTFPMAGEHCGLLTCQLSRARALDCLGLFAFPVPVPAPARALVLPLSLPREGLPELPQPPTGDAPSRRGSPSPGDYELREYRPGDPLRAIHWKLSSKHDQLVVREPVHSGLPQVVVTFDLFGDEVELDRVLDRLWTLSQALLDRGIPHTLVWLDRTRRQQERTVASRLQLSAALAFLLSQPAPDLPSLAAPDLSRLSQLPHIHLTGREEDAL